MIAMVTISQEEKASWTVIEACDDELILAKCVRVDVRKPAGRVSIVLTLLTDEGQPREVLRYFCALPCKGANKRNQCRIAKDSNLAKLYRLAIGKAPERYNKAKQLAKRLLEHEFLISPYPDGEADKFEYRTKVIHPKQPIKSECWGETGKLYMTPSSNRGWRKWSDLGINEGQSGDKEGTKAGQTWDSEKSEDPRYYLASTIGSTPNNQQSVTRRPISTVTTTVVEPLDRGINVIETGEKERHYQYQRHPDEIIEQYHDRVIDESF
jgi:hypothetical protein